QFSPSGVHLWSKQLGGTSNEVGYGVAADINGDVVLTGYVQGVVDFGGGPLNSIGSLDTFVAKFSSAGAYLWAKRFGAANPDEGLGIATDPFGNVLVVGSVQGNADFGTGQLAWSGGWDIVVAKYSPSGTPLW